MVNLTPSLDRSEFCCSCCDFDTVDVELPPVLQDAVDNFGGKELVMIVITGPNRCRKHNNSLREEWELSGGTSGAKTAKESMHIYGRAADFKMFYRDSKQQISPTKVYKYLDEKYAGRFGIKLYSNRVHFDTRAKAWRSA